jgi:hypothetical protein
VRPGSPGGGDRSEFCSGGSQCSSCDDPVEGGAERVRGGLLIGGWSTVLADQEATCEGHSMLH